MVEIWLEIVVKPLNFYPTLLFKGTDSYDNLASNLPKFGLEMENFEEFYLEEVLLQVYIPVHIVQFQRTTSTICL